MVSYHYWTTVTQADDDETSLSTTTPLITLSAATRGVFDTATRVVFWCRVAATVGTSSLPNLDWLAASTCDYLVYFDTIQSGDPINLTDEDPNIMGFVRMNQTMWLTPTANKYTVLWQGPVAGVNLEGQRKGYSDSILPAVSFQRWVSDNHGVFDNFAHFSVQFSSRLIGRVLWRSELPP